MAENRAPGKEMRSLRASWTEMVIFFFPYLLELSILDAIKGMGISVSFSIRTNLEQ
jgi:hypothetical protein